MTLRTLLDDAATRRPRRSALTFRRDGAWQTLTYSELAAGVRQTAEAFGRLGLVPGDETLALMLENGPEWVETYLAAAGSGVAVVPIDPKLRSEEVLHILRDSGAVLVVTDLRHREQLEAMLGELPALRLLVFVGGGAPASVAGRASFDYEALRASVGEGPCPWYASHAPAPHAIASVIYTSGTTGKPKGAMLSHINFCSDVMGALDAIGTDMVTSDDDFLVVLPLFHSFSFAANLVLPLAKASGMMFVESLRTMAEDLRTLRPTILMAVPLMVEKLSAKMESKLQASRVARALLRLGLRRLVGRLARAGLGGRLRFVVVGGAPCPLQVIKGLDRLGLTVVEGYGLTECSPIVTINSIAAPRFGTIGRKLPNIEVRLAEPDEQEVGELQVRGPIVMKGYYRDLEATRQAFDGDWLRTGDLASVDAEGNYRIRGRKKALIVNREGKNIYPEEVEQVIARDPLVADVVVVGYTVGDAPGERVGAIAVPNLEALALASGGAEPAWEIVVRRVREAVLRQCDALAEYKHPRKVEVRREPLTRTSVQKVRRCLYQGALNE